MTTRSVWDDLDERIKELIREADKQLDAADALAELAKEIIREYDPETATIDCASPEDFAEWCNKRAQAALSKWEEVSDV